MAADSGANFNKWFSQIEAVTVVSALLLALATPGAAMNWLIGNSLKKMQFFCSMIKQGNYQTRLVLPNEPRDKEDEDIILSLMRDMNWMARQIELREQELKKAITELRDYRQQIEKQNQSLSNMNADLLITQEKLNNRTFELEDALARMQLMALTDSLTTIANRRCFFDTLERQLRLPVCGYRPVSLLMIDVDHFKAINDNYGHETGDSVLCKIALIINEYCRENDLAARIGGEEFTVLLSNVCSKEAIGIAHRIKTAISSWKFEVGEGQRTSISVSIGICTMSQVFNFDGNKMYRYADQALYYSKSNGRNCVSIFDLDTQSAIKVA
ncbi:MAG: diguanylate cyclase [Firmicutes bacterium]|nr:diguanylate cyclase [Bacillota bacterium]